MSNSNSQLDGLGSFNQLAENAGTIKYGAFNNASKNTGTIALSAIFNNTSQNLGTIGDILPISTATVIQANSANWDNAFTFLQSNSSNLSYNIIEIDGVMYDNNAFAVVDENTVIDGFTYQLSAISKGTIITTTDGYRYSYKGEGGKRFASSYIQLADITPNWNVITNKPSTFDPSSHNHDASEITSGKLDIDRIPVLPSMEVVVIDGVMYDNNAFAVVDENTVIDGFTYQLSAIAKGTVITTNDGYRYVYKGEGGKRFASSYIQLADITPNWNVITNKPSTFDPSYHTHTVSEISDLSSHTHNISDIIGLGDILNAKLDTSYSYVTANSANIVVTSDNRLSKASTAYSYVTANSASIVLTSDSRLANATTAHSYVTTNSANIVMTSDIRLSNSVTIYNTVQSNSATWAVGALGVINYTIDGGGSAITTGSKGFVQIPSNFVVQEWNIIADSQTTSFTVDIRKASYNNIPTTTSIVGADPLKLTDQQKNRNLSVSWTNISAGDLVEFYVTDASNASLVNISLKGYKS